MIGFVLFWPIGLGLLVYMIWSKRMGCNWGRHHNRHRTGMGRTGNYAPSTPTARRPCKRLEEERDAFVSFLDQLRAAKDQAEFDQFIAGRNAPQPA